MAAPMTLDFSAILPTLIAGFIAWLVRFMLETFSKKLDRLLDKLDGLDKRQDSAEARVGTLELILKQRGWL